MMSSTKSIYFHSKSNDEIISKSFEISKFTHGHIRSQLCCAYYSLLVKAILNNLPLSEAMDFASDNLEDYIPDKEKKVLKRILSKSILKEKVKKVSASGYVVHTLEASLWCCNQAKSFSEAVLTAVNLGEDTDTVGAVTGGLTGLMQGVDCIPLDWVTSIARYQYIQSTIDLFIDAVLDSNLNLYSP